MKKNLSYLLKGGIIGLVVGILVSAVLFLNKSFMVCHVTSRMVGSPVICSYVWQYYLILFLVFIILGLVIGFVVGKIKNKKKKRI